MRGDNVNPGAMFSYVTPAQRKARWGESRRNGRCSAGTLPRVRSAVLAGRTAVDSAGAADGRLVAHSTCTDTKRRLLMEQLDYNLLFRWFVGLEMDDPGLGREHPSTFSKNRERLLAGDVWPSPPERAGGASKRCWPDFRRALHGGRHQLEAWGSHKSFQKKDESDDDRGSGGGRNRDVDCRGEPRKNDTHQRTTDPDARMYTKGPHQGAKAVLPGPYRDRELKRSGDARRSHHRGWNHREREAAARLMADTPRRSQATVGAGKTFDTAGFLPR